MSKNISFHALRRPDRPWPRGEEGVLTCAAMNHEELLAWRRRRLSQLVKEMGSSRIAGQAIGHKGGEQIRGMLSGQRAITDNTMDELEALPGRENWFGRFGPPPADGSGGLLSGMKEVRAFLAMLPAGKLNMARVALKYFIDNPDEILEVSRSLEALDEDDD